MATKKTTPSKSIANKALSELMLLDRSELSRELDTARRELYINVMKKHLGELKQPHVLKGQRRYIAQISTFLTSSI